MANVYLSSQSYPPESSEVIRANLMPFSAISPTSHSSSLRKPSDATSTRSIGFASDRSPLQNLELELKHISKEEFDAPGVGRSLSKRQEERIQRSTTITSRLTASPPVPSPINTYSIGDESHQHRSHRMAQLLGSSPSEVKSEDGRRNSPPNADALGKPQSATKLPPAQISGRDRIGRKSYQGYRFQHLRRTSSSGTKSNKGDHARITRAAGGKDVFDVKVAHLTIEDREFNYQSLNGGDATKDDGTRIFYKKTS